jgi:eukaryotic-like serine/threonine-protein kinase
VRVGWPDAVAVAIEVAQALAHVHERSGADGAPLGIVHRDLSPQNVMIGHGGEVKLIDFGTARGHNRRCHTVAGVVFAKPGYVAPEVARQQVGDGRIDLYALGVVLWELCAGRRLLTTDPQRHLDDVAAGRVVLPALAAACGAPAALDEVIAKLTRNDPDERYARASLSIVHLAALLVSAPAMDAGERGVRARIAALMRRLWPNEPARSRAEFARLLRDARATMGDDPGSDGGAGETRDARDVDPALGDGSAGAASVRRLTARPSSPDGLTQAAHAHPTQLAGTPYRLIRTIGRGATGVVWEGEHVELGRRMALKVLALEHASSPAALERFRCEARAVAGLSHPNVVQILDFGRSLDGRAFLAMELIAGESLDATFRRGPLGWVEAARIAVATCGALSAAHTKGLVHRDIKPQNLMVTARGEVKLLDFGIARAAADGLVPRVPGVSERALQGFAVFGTPEYMAPEQVAGAAVDGRTDVYALGCLLYEMLTGTRPFDGPAVVVMGKQLRETPPPMATRAPGLSIPGPLEAAVARAMAKDPAQRFPSAAAMGDALEQALSAAERRKARALRVARWALAAMTLVAVAWVSAHVTWMSDAGMIFPARPASPRLPVAADLPAATAATAGVPVAALPAAPPTPVGPGVGTASTADPADAALQGSAPATRTRPRAHRRTSASTR